MVLDESPNRRKLIGAMLHTGQMSGFSLSLFCGLARRARGDTPMFRPDSLSAGALQATGIILRTGRYSTKKEFCRELP